MSTTYKPKHKKPTPFAGNTPRGPQRWARAADNALTHPNSKGAKLFFDRIVTARKIVADYPADERTRFQFIELATERQAEWGHPGQKRLAVTCSLHCTVMQAQLDWSTTKYANIAQLLETSKYVVVKQHAGRTWELYTERRVYILDTSTLARDAKCSVCGTVVKRNS